MHGRNSGQDYGSAGFMSISSTITITCFDTNVDVVENMNVEGTRRRRLVRPLIFVSEGEVKEELTSVSMKYL